MSLIDDAIRIVDDWYAGLDLYQDHLPSKGSVGAAIHVLSRLRGDYQLDVAAHVAGGESQIAGLSAGSLRKVLAEFGENRALTSVAGRSNRGARGDVASLLNAMRALNLEKKEGEKRVEVLKAMQQHLVNAYISRFFAVKRVKAVFDPASATARFIDAILENARLSGKAGAVAEYLIGAKLACLFPKKDIRNKRFSTSDVQSGYSGDFEVGTTAFHVSVAPMPELFQKLKGNLERGLRVYLLVPGSQVVGAQQNATLMAGDKVAVESIQSFVATNIDEHTEFDGEKLKSGFRRLLDKYNERVAAIELDKSMLIDIPPNLE
jgi:hypothetical protein